LATPAPSHPPQLPAPDPGYEYAERVIDGQQYITTGQFAIGVPKKTLENLYRAPALVFDMDVKDRISHTEGIKDKAVLDERINTMSAEDVQEAVAALWMECALPALEAVFGQGTQPNALVVSGAGLHMYLWVADHEGRGDEVHLVRAVNREAAKRMNAAAGWELVALKTTDAGTRILRQVGTMHTKNPDRPLRVRIEGAVRDDVSFEVGRLAQDWGVSVDAAGKAAKKPDGEAVRVPTALGAKILAASKAGEPIVRADPVQGDVLLAAFGSREAALKEMAGADPVFQFATAHPSEVGREMWRLIGINLIACAEEPSDEAREVFHTISALDARRYDVAKADKFFDHCADSYAAAGPLTYQRLIDEEGEALWERMFPPGTRQPDLESSPAGQQSKRATAVVTGRPAPKTQNRRNDSDSFQTGRLGPDFEIEGAHWEGRLDDWVKDGPKEKVEGLGQAMPITCPWTRKDTGRNATVYISDKDGKTYLSCRQPRHMHYEQGRVAWWLDEDGQTDTAIEVAARMRRRPAGTPVACVPNVKLVLEGDDRFWQQYWYDEYRKEVMVGSQPVVDSDIMETVCAMGERYALDVGKDMMWSVAEMIAKRNGRNPVTDWLQSLEWDGTSRIGDFLTKSLNVADTPLAREYATRWVTAVAARTLHPGCKMDNVLVLVGGQGFYKSTVLETLVGGDLFSDTAIDLRSKDAYQQVHQVAIYEFGEFRALRVSQAHVKQFLSSKTDRFRPPYKRTIEVHPRHTVFAATSNEMEILTDETGSRRYWPVLVPGKYRQGLVWLVDNREQLLAEAVHRFKLWFDLTEGGSKRLLSRGEEFQWWLDDDKEEERHLEADTFSEIDGRQDPVAIWAVGREHFSMEEVLEGCLLLTRDRQDKRAQNEVGAVLRRLGFEKKRVRVAGKAQWVWHDPNAKVLKFPMATKEEEG